MRCKVSASVSELNDRLGRSEAPDHALQFDVAPTAQRLTDGRQADPERRDRGGGRMHTPGEDPALAVERIADPRLTDPERVEPLNCDRVAEPFRDRDEYAADCPPFARIFASNAPRLCSSVRLNGVQGSGRPKSVSKSDSNSTVKFGSASTSDR